MIPLVPTKPTPLPSKNISRIEGLFVFIDSFLIYIVSNTGKLVVLCNLIFNSFIWEWIEIKFDYKGWDIK